MTEEVRALLFAATQTNRLSRALAAELGPLVGLLAHAYRIGFVRGRGEVLAMLDRVPESVGGDEPSELLFEDLGHVRHGEMQPGDVGMLVGMLARAYELGLHRGAHEIARHMLGAVPERAAAIASTHVRRFEAELRFELCESIH